MGRNGEERQLGLPMPTGLGFVGAATRQEREVGKVGREGPGARVARYRVPYECRLIWDVPHWYWHCPN